MNEILWGLQTGKTIIFSSLNFLPVDSLEHKLYEKGYILAGLIEEANQPTLLTSHGSSGFEIFTCLHRCSILDEDLEQWYHELEEESAAPLF